MQKYIILTAYIFLLSTFFIFPASAGIIDPDLRSVLETAEAGEPIPVIFSLAHQVDLGEVRGQKKEARRENLVRSLRGKAIATQAPLVGFLRSRGVKDIKPFWIFNGMAFEAPASVIYELARQPGVAMIRLDEQIPEHHLASNIASADTTAAPEWHLGAIGAPDLWNLGYAGEGRVVASLDTGVDALHPDLEPQWRGGDNSWFDPHGEHLAPYDSNGHGTQVMGLMVGGAAGGSAIGVAPAAQWIAVKIYDDAGAALFSTIHQGLQWLLDPDGNPATDDAPDVVNNSWGLRESIDQCVQEFQPDLAALNTAGIAVVFSAGNEGPAPATSISPANNSESLAVGAVDSSYAVALSSSRGPSACDGDIYPKLVAPGVNVRTSDLTFGGVVPDPYTTVSGTSFAAPQTAGALALLRGAFPERPVGDLQAALEDSATDLGLTGPDHDYGAGLINVAEAYHLLSGAASSCTDSDGDGFFAENDCGTPPDCNDVDASIFPNAQEIKHDGLDQDCNGYDLSIEIIEASYSAKRDTLVVAATSALGPDANLELSGYGSMKWSRKDGSWTISVRKAGGNPGVVTVAGPEGSETTEVY